MAQDTLGGLKEPPQRDPLGRLAFGLLLSMALFLSFFTIVVIVSAIRGGTGSSTAGIFPAVLMASTLWFVLFVIWRARRFGPPPDEPDPPAPTNSTTGPAPTTPWATGLPPPPPHWPSITYDGNVRGVRHRLFPSWLAGQLRIEQDQLVMGNRRTAFRYGRNRVRGLHLSPMGILSIDFVDGRQASVQFAQTREIDPQPDMAEALRNRGWPVVDERLPIARL